MNTAIGPSGAGHGRLVPSDGRNGPFQFFLDGPSVRLALPSDEIRSVILQSEFDVPHHTKKPREAGLGLELMDETQGHPVRLQPVAGK